MSKKLRRFGQILLLCLAGLLLNGCLFRGTRSYFDIVGPRMMSEFYRGEGVICTPPERFENTDSIVVGISFDFAIFGHSCEEQSRKVLVTLGTGLVNRTENAKVNQIVTVIGTFEGPAQEVLIAHDITIQRR
ncbi:MAG: hypothetical protein AAGM22_29355 [Acidobacteriota bacterium]